MVRLNMQKINDNLFSKIFGKLYVQFSSKNYNGYYNIPKELENYVKYVRSFFTDKDIKIHYEEINKKYNVKDNNKVLCAYSGGKDSLANVINLQQKGYEPILCYIKGLNRSYPKEQDAVEKIANTLNLELVVLQVSISGKCDYIENPVKNALILSMLVDYGIKLDINKYSFGNMMKDNANSLPKDVELSDGIEFFNLLEQFYKNFINGFEIITTLKNETYSYKTICDKDIHLLQNTASCMMPYRYLKQFHDKNELKYNYKFKDTSCGCSCYKCCQELYVLYRLGYIDLSQELLNQCYKIMKQFDLKNETSTIWFDDEVLQM